MNIVRREFPIENTPPARVVRSARKTNARSIVAKKRSSKLQVPVALALLALMGASRVDAAQTMVDAPAAPSQPPVATVSFVPSNIQVGETSMMTIKLSNGNASDNIIGVHLIDHYPIGMASPGFPVQSDTCGFTEGVSDPTMADLSNGTVTANSSCSIVIQVVGTAPAIAVNHTGTITSSNAPDGVDASATLTIGLPAPNVTKSFDPTVIFLGGSSRMTIDLQNTDATHAVTGAKFTDTYPAPLMIANAATNTVISNTCGGSVDAAVGATSVALTGGTIPAGSHCSVVVNVVSTAAGFTTNHTGAVTSDNATSVADATGTIIINNVPLLNAPDVSETFTPTHVGPGGSSQMSISFGNPNAQVIFGVQVNDIYPAGMINPNSLTDPVVSDTCGFVHDVPKGGGWAKFTGSLPVGSCSVVINVVADVMAATTLTNPTGPIVSGNAAASPGATGDLVVDSNVPTITCTLPSEVDIVGDTINIDLVPLFMPPPGQALVFDATNPPPGVALQGSLLSGILATAGTFTTTLTATVNAPGGLSASEDVLFNVLPLDELVFRDAFDFPAAPCQ